MLAACLRRLRLPLGLNPSAIVLAFCFVLSAPQSFISIPPVTPIRLDTLDECQTRGRAWSGCSRTCRLANVSSLSLSLAFSMGSPSVPSPSAGISCHHPPHHQPPNLPTLSSIISCQSNTPHKLTDILSFIVAPSSSALEPSTSYVASSSPHSAPGPADARAMPSAGRAPISAHHPYQQAYGSLRKNPDDPYHQHSSSSDEIQASLSSSPHGFRGSSNLGQQQTSYTSFPPHVSTSTHETADQPHHHHDPNSFDRHQRDQSYSSSGPHPYGSRTSPPISPPHDNPSVASYSTSGSTSSRLLPVESSSPRSHHYSTIASSPIVPHRHPPSPGSSTVHRSLAAPSPTHTRPGEGRYDSSRGRTPSRVLLQYALDLAQQAVMLDQDNRFAEALEMYKETVARLAEVMARVDASEEKRNGGKGKTGPGAGRAGAEDEGRTLRGIVS